MSEWSIANLGPSLAGLEAESGSRRLGPGRWVVRITSAKVVPVGAGGTGRAVRFEFEEVGGAGEQTDQINVHLPGKNPQAVEIGKKRLVSLLKHSDWPFEPAELGARDDAKIDSLVGKIVGLVVERDDEEWVTKSGEVRSGSNKPAKFGAYFDPETIGFESKPAPVQQSQASSQSAAAHRPIADNEVPF